MWSKFIQHSSIFCRPFLDFKKNTATQIEFFTDASKSVGVGVFCGNSWMHAKWDKKFIQFHDPSIGFLELYGVTAGVMNWIHGFKNMRIVLFCDNQSAVDMINSTSSKCKRCMILIRIIVLQSLIHNVKITERHVSGISNELADFLSRGKIQQFKDLAVSRGKAIDPYPTEIPQEIWPLSKLWY